MSPSIIINDLDAKHPGLTPALAASYYEAAGVCLDRHHSLPHAFTVIDNNVSTPASIAWSVPNTRVKAAWANADDATRDGAYAVAIASVEMTRGLYTVSRAETRTGCDYYVDTPEKEALDLETAIRLEVSGTDKGNKSVVVQRLQEKAKQAQAGKSPLPAIAAVVGFAASLVLTKDV